MALPNDYQSYIHASRYARFSDELGRRETWEETVNRLIAFWKGRFPTKINDSTLNELRAAITGLSVMPSMRTLMTAGKALDRDEVAAFNCSYTTIESVRDFDEILYILMCGTGVGFSVESKYTNKLPVVADTFHDTDTVIVVGDSKIGWASAFRELLALLWAGKVPKWDVSKVRAAGERLKTFGGRASGPKPLVALFDFSVAMLKKAAGRQLTPLECHDLVCKIADIVVVGGVRRSALISLSDLGDSDIRVCKSGQWWVDNNQRALANNSAVYESKPSLSTFMQEWNSLYQSYSGERGIFSRVASQKQAALNGRRDASYEFGTNPCSEIILRPHQFCNLSEVVIRAGDSLADLKAKVEWATILGTLQSTLTNFRYLRKVWENNTKEECLLGVSLTGICDHDVLNGNNGLDVTREWLEEMKQVAIKTNEKWATILGVNQSTAITCVKPSGTVSQLVDSASGIHPRYAPYYIRRVRADKKDPLAQFMIDQGFPVEDDVMKPDSTYVFAFPMKVPEGALVTKEVSAQQQLNLWMVYQEAWCEHKPSVTIYYKDSEFLSLGQQVYNLFDKISGISFLPYSEHTYQQAPYTECTATEYYSALGAMPEQVDWSLAAAYDRGVDNTESMQTLACTGGACEL